MITSADIRDLTLADFYLYHNDAIIGQEVEKIMGLVLEEAYLKQNKILLYDVSHLLEMYYDAILAKLRQKFSVSSIYLQNKTIYVDWSL